MITYFAEEDLFYKTLDYVALYFKILFLKTIHNELFALYKCYNKNVNFKAMQRESKNKIKFYDEEKTKYLS